MNKIMIRVVQLLREILDDKGTGLESIKMFQKIMWDAAKPQCESNKSWEALCDLAYDLDYYEPNEEERKRDPSLYGESRMKEEIRSVLSRIEK